GTTQTSDTSSQKLSSTDGTIPAHWQHRPRTLQDLPLTSYIPRRNLSAAHFRREILAVEVRFPRVVAAQSRLQSGRPLTLTPPQAIRRSKFRARVFLRWRAPVKKGETAVKPSRPGGDAAN